MARTTTETPAADAPVTPAPETTKFTYSSEKEDGGLRVTAQRGSWTANTLAATEDEGKKALRDAYKHFHPASE